METTLRFSSDEPFFKGHYPDFPVTPGVMLIDRAVTAAKSMLGGDFVLKGIKKVKFSNPVFPGETVSLKVESRGKGEMSYSFSKDGRQCASGILYFDCGCLADDYPFDKSFLQHEMA
ncbi:MAG: hypothetical protein IKK82_13320 [Kiritimatiellae bacterium]|nr:hypothetical protein [Kiritimatiellia bacterium]